MTRRNSKPDAGTLYVCVTSYADDKMVGQQVIPAGARLRGSHPAVAANFAFWTPADSSDDEIAVVQQSIGAPVVQVR